MFKMLAAAMILSFTGLGGSPNANAQAASSNPAELAEKQLKDPSTERKLGWTKAANLGTNISFTSSQDVVGQVNGSSQTYGLNLKSSFKRLTERTEWRNTFSYTGATTNSPALPRFVKSNDDLRAETIYLYSFENHPTVGPYVRAEAAAPIFIGQDVRQNSTDYTVQDPYGVNQPPQVRASSFRLTDGFKPLTTKEATGFFWKPVQTDRLKIEARFGAAANQIQGSGQYAVQGTSSTGGVLVRQLTDVYQAGSELALGVKGKINDNSAYEAGAEAMTPWMNNKRNGDERDPLTLTNVDGFLKLSSNITSWAAFGYDYRLKIQPQLVNRSQQIHMMVLNINYNLL